MKKTMCESFDKVKKMVEKEPTALVECQRHANFCDKCCSNFLGTKYIRELKTCDNSCSKAFCIADDPPEDAEPLAESTE